MNSYDEGNPNPSLSDKAGPKGPRSKDNVSAVNDDLGLESGLQPQDVEGDLDEVKPDPDKAGKTH